MQKLIFNYFNYYVANDADYHCHFVSITFSLQIYLGNYTVHQLEKQKFFAKVRGSKRSENNHNKKKCKILDVYNAAQGRNLLVISESERVVNEASVGKFY